ncbi:MAG: hypothetical protein WCJ88_05125 [Actinomycetes bacterium]
MISICSLPDGSRRHSTTNDSDAHAAVMNDEWVETSSTVIPTDAGSSRLLL